MNISRKTMCNRVTLASVPSWLQEIKSLQHQTKVAQQRHDQLTQQVKDKENELKQLEDTTRKLDVQLEEGKLQRQKVRSLKA